jgi:hypothetical protein
LFFEQHRNLNKLGASVSYYLFVFASNTSYICFVWVLEVVTSVATSPYPFYFVFVPRIASNREEIRFGEGAVPKQIMCCLPKNSYLPARTSDFLEFFCALASGYYATFISFALFHLSNRRSSKNHSFCTVLFWQISANFCICPLILPFCCSYMKKELYKK